MTTDYLSYSADWSNAGLVSAYDELPLWSAMFGQLLLDHVPLRRGSTVLDVGCGTGFPLLELAERLGGSSRVFGIDPWEAARRRGLEKARLWQVTNVEMLNGDAASLPFPAGMCDLVVSNLGINNFADPRQVMLECARVARLGAVIAITTNLVGHMREFYSVFASTLKELGLAGLLPALEAHIAHRATLPGVSRLFESAGFHVEKVVEQAGVIRFANGSALLRHHFIRQGFLDGWKSVVPETDLPRVFIHLEEKLNRLSEEQGEIRLTIPMAYIEGGKHA